MLSDECCSTSVHLSNLIEFRYFEPARYLHEWDPHELLALATLWCEKMEHLYGIYLSHGPGYSFTDADLDSFEEALEIAAILADNPRPIFVQRLARIRREVRPRLH